MADPRGTKDALRRIVEEVSVRSERELCCRNESVALGNTPPRKRDAARYHADPVVHGAQEFLYRRYYACFDREGKGEEMSGENWLEQLAAANDSRTYWDGGWRVDEVGEKSQVTASKDSRSAVFQPGGYACCRKTSEVKKGDEIEVRLFCDSVDLQPGMYFAFGETLPDRADMEATLRIYWNATADGALSLVEEATRIFNRYRTPLRLKCPATRGAFGRVDSMVMYVGAGHAQHALDLLEPVYQRVARDLVDEAPLFTRSLSPGLAVAESPRSRQSFGSDRCRVAAEGLVTAWRNKVDSPGGKFEAVEQAFSRAGISLDQPYLNVAGCDPFGVGELKFGNG